MKAMRNRGSSDTGSRSWARRSAFIVIAGLLLGTVDLHALVHHRQHLAERALAAAHPDPAHLDTARSPHELPCLACAAGLKSQGRPAEGTGTIAAHAECGELTIEASTARPGRLPCRLPPSRAPPLS